MQRSAPIIVLVSLLLFAACGDPKGASDPVEPTAAEEPVFVGPGYGGVDACVDCHAERVESYRRTAHYQTLRRPDPEVFAARIAAVGGRLETRKESLHHEIEVQDGQAFQTSVLSLGSREIRRREAIDFIMGSGRIFEGYLSWDGDRLMQLPVGWFAAAGSWSNCPGYDDGQARYDREILPRCLDCHGTWAETRGGARYRPESVMPGLSCERCHGPGREHVLHHRAHPEAEEGVAIVMPARLPRARRLDLCAQCHAEPGELIGEAFSYRPGEPLGAYVRQESGHGGEVFVHTANQIQRLATSACFRSSPELDCISCHRTHAPEGEQLLRRSLRACQGCHEAAHRDDATGLPAALRDRCVACHMPSRQVSDTVINTRRDDFLGFFRMTEHRIGIHEDASRELRARERLAEGDEAGGRAELLALGRDFVARAERSERGHRFVESMAFLREAGRLAPELAPDAARLAALAQRERRRAEALAMVTETRRAGLAGDLGRSRRQLEAALAIDPGQPEATVLLAELDRLGGDLPAAESRLASVLDLRPDFADAALGLADLRLAAGRVEEAIAPLEGLVRAQPLLARARLLLARARAAKGDFRGALDDLDHYLERVPGDRLAVLNRAAMLLECGRAAEARRVAEDLAGAASGETAAACAEFLDRLGLGERARSLWLDLLRDPDLESRARAALAGMALDENDPARATELLAPLDGRRDDATVLATQARLARTQRRLREAEVLLGEALRAGGDHGLAQLEFFRLLAGSRATPPERLRDQALIVATGAGGRDPRTLVELAEVLVGRENEVARGFLAQAAARAETALIPGLQERIRALELGLDGSEGPR
ncbi:MAG: tetratricopeptide repeat protein [Planctomycetes bacterium]|nr:tetratricopeptide repeat protein [Planctomycetota bacterium]